LFGIKKGLKKTKESFFKKILNVLKKKKLSSEDIEKIEEVLIAADIGVETTMEIIQTLEEQKLEDPLQKVKEILLEILDMDTSLKIPDKKPFVLSLVGVNGTGKTTTAGKLGKIFRSEGKEVVLAAADTFRAAAIEQLKLWGERINATVVAHTEGADPGAVAFDAVVHAKAKGKDVVIIDTAGRLHNKKHLMEELRKIHRVVKKEVPDAPHEALLVIDATTGQNGLIQAKVFKEIVDITGIVLAKLDGTAKGGIAVAIVKELGVPIKFVGVGEGEDDLKPFDAHEFVEALFEE